MNQRVLTRGAGRLLSLTAGSGVFKGYASLFNQRDGQGDIVMPGAFADSLKRRGPADIRMLFQHDPAEPVGTWLEISENPRGLFVLGRLNRHVQRGRELMALLETGGLDGLSIGFRTVHAAQDRARQGRLLKTIDLWEISLVTFPMLDGARVSKAQRAARARAEALFRNETNPA